MRAEIGAPPGGPRLRLLLDEHYLIDGFETPYGLELLATTHWVAVHEQAGDAAAAAELVRDWSQRKGHLFTDGHVAVAWQRLDEGGWLAGTRVPAGV